MPSDLHMHTTFSDGRLTPEELVAAAKTAGLSYMAITDHDTVAAIPAARAEIARAGVDAFVAGSAVYGAGKDSDPHRYDSIIGALRGELGKV